MLCKIHDGRCWCENMKRIVFQNFICLNCLGSFASSIYLFVYTVVNGRNTKNLQNFICLDSERCSSYLSCCAICRMDAAGTGIWNVLLVSPSSASQLTAASASPHLPAAPGGTPPTFLPSLDNIDTIDNNNNDKKTTFTPLLVPSCWYHNKQRHVPSTQAPLHSERALATLKTTKTITTTTTMTLPSIATNTSMINVFSWIECAQWMGLGYHSETTQTTTISTMTTTKTIITLLVDAYDQPLSSSSSWLETSLQTCKETLTLNVDIDNNNNSFFGKFCKGQQRQQQEQ